MRVATANLDPELAKGVEKLNVIPQLQGGVSSQHKLNKSFREK